jgi:hypothetical protein
MLIERDLIGAVPPEPEAMPVARLIDGDTVDPGPERGLSAEAMNGPEDAEEHLLSEIQRFLTIAKEVRGQLEDDPLVLRHELFRRPLVAGRAALNERGLGIRDFRPSDDPCLLHFVSPGALT